MSDPSDRITIRPEELAAGEPQRITIRPEELRAKPPPLPAARDAPIVAEFADAKPLVPAPHTRSALPVVLFLGGGVLLLAVLLAVMLLGTYWGSRKTSRPAPRDWKEQAARQAEHGVVVIQADSSAIAAAASPADGEADGPQHRVAFGTGFVVASSGNRHLVLTNRHVVGDAATCRVTAGNGGSTQGAIAGRPNADDVDLALLLVESNWLRPLGPVSSYDQVRQGEDVVAIGHPLGLDFTVSSGIISAKRGRDLQTSAPISPGNSGGPLVNQHGAVIGVNTRIIDPSEGTSLGFAVRADIVLDPSAWSYTSPEAEALARRIQRAP
jgi:S1-C subfamily serine protease